MIGVRDRKKEKDDENSPTYQGQAVEEKQSKDHHETSQDDNLGRFYNKSHQSGHDKDEAGVYQAPGEPARETQHGFNKWVVRLAIYQE